MITLRKYLASIALLPALLAAPSTQAEALYTINVLPENFYPSAINNAGQIAGIADSGNGNLHAALYAGGVVTDLASFGGAYFDIVSIKDDGTVLGNVSPTVGDNRAFVYRNGSMHEIPGLYAYGLNAGGDIVGYNGGAVLYHQGTLTQLGYLGSGDFSTARGINDAGDIVGTSTIDLDFHSRQHPFLYRDGTLHDLGTLDEREFNSAVAINNVGQIAGYSEGTGGGMHAFLYENGVMTDLGSFGGLNLTVGGMNEHGQIVGTGEPWEGDRVGFISQDGGLVDLNTLIDPALGWQIGGAIAINDQGQILAYACREFACTNVRLDLAAAVPEPASVLSLLCGLILLASTCPALLRRFRRPRWCGMFAHV